MYVQVNCVNGHPTAGVCAQFIRLPQSSVDLAQQPSLKTSLLLPTDLALLSTTETMSQCWSIFNTVNTLTSI